MSYPDHSPQCPHEHSLVDLAALWLPLFLRCPPLPLEPAFASPSDVSVIRVPGRSAEAAPATSCRSVEATVEATPATSCSSVDDVEDTGTGTLTCGNRPPPNSVVASLLGDMRGEGACLGCGMGMLETLPATPDHPSYL